MTNFSLCLRLAVVALMLSLFGFASSALAQAKSGPTKKVRDLRKEKLGLLTKLHDAAEKDFWERPPGLTESLLCLKSELVKAQLALCQKTDERQRVLEKMINDTKKMEEYFVGGGEFERLRMRVQVFRIGLRIALEEEKEKAKPN